MLFLVTSIYIYSCDVLENLENQSNNHTTSTTTAPWGSDHLSRRIKSDAGIHKSDLPTDYTRAAREEGIDGLTSYATLLDCREISDNLVKCTDYPRKASSPPPLVITPSFAKSPPSTRFDETANSRVGMIKDIVNT